MATSRFKGGKIMSKYSMSGANDISRLEKQNDQKNYNLNDELAYFNFDKGDLILDAGCGSGLVTRAIANEFRHKNLRFEACDYSEVAVSSAKSFFGRDKINVRTFISSVEAIDSEDDKYDKVISRYVLEHMKNPIDATKEFFRVLRPGGYAYIIDLDGILFNLHTENQILNEHLFVIKKSFKFDLFVGRKLPTLLARSGFEGLKWEAVTMSFNTEEEKRMELVNYESRFNLAKEVIVNALGSEKTFEEFKVLYLNELAKEENVLFYTKFCVSGYVKKK